MDDNEYYRMQRERHKPRYLKDVVKKKVVKKIEPIVEKSEEPEDKKKGPQ